MGQKKFIHFSATLAAGIFIGGTLGWSLKPAPVMPSGNFHDTALERHRPSRPATVSTSRFASELKAIKDQNFKINPDDPGKDSSYLEALAAELLKAGGSDTKMGGEEKHGLFVILEFMAQKNLGRTLDWIDESIDQKDRSGFYRNAILAGMKNSPVRDQLDLFKSRGFTPREIGDFAGILMMGYESMSTETALYLLGHVQPDGGFSGGNARFDESFDYARFADATLQMAKANKNRPPQVYLMNFFSEWTRMDPQAAASFYFTHYMGKDRNKEPFNTLETFMKDLRANIPESDYDRFATTTLSQQFLAAEPDKAFIDELLRTGISIPDDLAENLNRIPDPTVRDKLLSETVSRAAEASAGQGGNLMQLRGALALYSDPVARLGSVEAYARGLSERNGARQAPQIIRNLCNQLAILGHSETDLKRVRNAAGTNGR